MYKKKFTTTTLLLLVLLCGFHVVRAQTYGRCDEVDEYVYAYAAADDNMQREETFTLTVDRNVTIQYGFDSQEQAKGGATVCLYYAGGGLTTFGCESGRDGSGSTVLFLPAGSYRVVAGAASVNPNGEGNDMISGWIRVTSDKITPLSFNVTGGGSGCDGGNATFPIGLGNSEPGVTYQLSRDNVPVATVTSGGGPFSFGNFQTPGTYTVATVSPCVVVSMLGYAVITDPRPSSFTAWNNGPKCEASQAPDIDLGATDIPGATYTWTGPYGATQTTSGNRATIKGLTGKFEYKVYANINGCITPTVSTWVEVFPAPPQAIAYALSNVCGLGTTLNATPAGPGFTGRWELASFPTGGQSNFTTPNSNTTQVNVTVPGTYTYHWLITGAPQCAASVGAVSVTFNIDPLERPVSITNNGLRCSADSPLTISLSNSQPGISYQVLINGAPTGTVLPGNGGTLVWQDLGSGAYKIKASGTGGCERIWDAGTVSVTETPALRTVSGSTTVCAGTPVSVTLANPEPSVTYQLFNNGTLVAGAPANSGNTLSWAVQASGNYTVRATRGNCTQQMSNTAIITINPVPAEYEVSGGGTQCFGGAGFPITLDGSQANVKYQLQVNNQNTGVEKTGNGSMLTWTGQTTDGAYTVIATHNSGSCTRLMKNSGHITINQLPTKYPISGGGTYCSGSKFAITLNNSETGVRYQLKRGSTILEDFREGSTGAPISWGDQVLALPYSIIATNMTTQCTQSMGTVFVQLNPSPQQFMVSGGGERCDDKPGLTVSLNGSEAPQNGGSVRYQLLRDNAIKVRDSVLGTGNAISWKNLTESGIYTIKATHSSGCTKMMFSAQDIIINTKTAPTPANAGPDIMNICGLQTTLQANDPTVGIGHWEQVSGYVQSQFGDPLSHTTSVSVTLPNTFVYAWVITNGIGCISADSVSVIYNAIPSQAEAGEEEERTICDDIFAELNANVAASGNGTWTVSGPEGSVIVPDVNTPNAYLVVSAPGQYICRWTIANGPCPASKDSVLINFGLTNEPFTVIQSLNGGEKQYLIAEAQTDATWRDTHTYQWLYTNSSNVQTNVTNTAIPWQTQMRIFPDFLSGNVTDATLQVDVYSYGCLSRQVFGKDISGGTFRRQEKPAMQEETLQPLDEDVQIYPVPASESLTVQIPFEGTWKAELRNMNGALIQTVTNNERTSIFDVSAIPAGLYVLYIQSNSKRVVRKVEVVR